MCGEWSGQLIGKANADRLLFGDRDAGVLGLSAPALESASQLLADPRPVQRRVSKAGVRAMALQEQRPMSRQMFAQFFPLVPVAD